MISRAGNLLLIATLYHLLSGALFFLVPSTVLRAFNIAPELYLYSFHVLMFRLLGVFNLTVGLGAYFVARRSVQNIDLARLLLLAKIGSALAFLYYAARGELVAFMLIVTFVNDLLWIPLLAWFARQGKAIG